MGQGESKVEPKIIQVKTRDRSEDDIELEYDGIPSSEPLINRRYLGNFPDVKISSAGIAFAQENLKKYYGGLSFHISKNEEAICFHVQKQCGKFGNYAQELTAKQRKLSLTLRNLERDICDVDRELREAKMSLDAAVLKAESLASILNTDGSIPSFDEFSA